MAGCAESGDLEAGVRMPRSTWAFQPPKGVKPGTNEMTDRRRAEQARPGETLSTDRP